MEGTFHGLVVDIGMPDMDGFELLARVSARPRFSGLKLFALSAAPTRESEARAFKAGALHFFEKPLATESLLSFFPSPHARK